MNPKKMSAKDNAEKKRMMYVELKKEIIEKHDQGVRVGEELYDLHHTEAEGVHKGYNDSVKIIPKQRKSIHENIEKLWWCEDGELARRIYRDGD